MPKPSLNSATRNLLRHYARLLRTWPSDVLRPVTFHTSMRKRLRDRFLTPTAAASPADSHATARERAEKTAANIQGSGKPPDSTSSPDSTSVPVEEKASRVAQMTPGGRVQDEMEQVNALYSLLENRYSKTYPCSDRLLRPTSNEDYYHSLMAEMEEAPKRDWWTWKWLRLKGLVRMR